MPSAMTTPTSPGTNSWAVVTGAGSGIGAALLDVEDHAFDGQVLITQNWEV